MVDFLVSSDSTVKVVGTPTLTGHEDCAGIFSTGRAAVPNGVLPGPDLNFPVRIDKSYLKMLSTRHD
jgi:hypothetical protein